MCGPELQRRPTGGEDIPERKAFLDNQVKRAKEAPMQRVPMQKPMSPRQRGEAAGTGVRG